MQLSLKIVVFITFSIVFLATGLAQENPPFMSKDSLYREDQLYIGFTYNIVSAVPDGVKNRGLSAGIQFGALRDMPINDKRTLAVAIGLGLAFDQYGQNLFIGETPTEESIFTVLDEDLVTYDRNRFVVSQIEIPFEFRFRSSTPETYRFWRVHAGFRVGYAFYYRSTFIQPENSVSQTKIPEFNPLRASATLSFGYNSFNFYASYSITPFFTDATTTNGQQVDFKAIKLGLIFYLL